MFAVVVRSIAPGKKSYNCQSLEVTIRAAIVVNKTSSPSFKDCRSSRLELNLVSSEDHPPNNAIIFENRPKQGHLVTKPKSETKQIHLQKLTIS